MIFKRSTNKMSSFERPEITILPSPLFLIPKLPKEIPKSSNFEIQSAPFKHSIPKSPTHKNNSLKQTNI